MEPAKEADPKPARGERRRKRKAPASPAAKVQKRAEDGKLAATPYVPDDVRRIWINSALLLAATVSVGLAVGLTLPLVQRYLVPISAGIGVVCLLLGVIVGFVKEELKKRFLPLLASRRLSLPLLLVCLVFSPFAAHATAFEIQLSRQRFIAIVPGRNVFNLLGLPPEMREVVKVIFRHKDQERSLQLVSPTVIYLGDRRYLDEWLLREIEDDQQSRRDALAKRFTDLGAPKEVADERAAELDALQRRRFVDIGSLRPQDLVSVELRCGGSTLVEVEELEVASNPRVQLSWLETDNELSCP